MLKKAIFFILVILFLTFHTSYAMVGEEEEHERKNIVHSLQNSPFKELPNELVLAIAEHLYGEDFHNFTLICSPIRCILVSYKQFFIPEERAKVLEAIQGRRIEGIPQLILEWSRTARKKSIPLLRGVLFHFEDFTPQKGEKNFKPFQKNFKNYIKTMNILYGLGDKKNIVSILEKIYHKVQEGVSSTIEYEHPDGTVNFYNDKLYIFYIKNSSMMHQGTRTFLSDRYKEGVFPFTKDDCKSKKYRKELNLPLTTAVFSLHE